jgi:methylamine dehydrogenase accessory protein MauD
MSGPWLASYIVLWAVVLFQGGLIFLLLRQMGVMYLGTGQGVARDGLAPGQRAPDFTLPDVAGATVSLADFQGLPLLLVFGSPNCAPCKLLIPDLNVFAHERREELRVLFLSRGALEDTRQFVSEAGAEVPVATHPDDELSDKYKARVTPFAFLIDGEGVIRAKGLANNREHLEMLLRAASEEPPDGEKTVGRNGRTTEGRELTEDREPAQG